MKLAKSLGIAAFAAISVAAAEAQPTQAAIVRYNFTVNATSGNNPGQYFGTLQYDDITLTGSGKETLGVENGLRVTFNYLDNIYTELDDEFYDFYPIVSFNNGGLLGLNYFVADQFFIGDDVNNSDVGGNRFYEISDSVFTTEVGTVTYSKVPEPFAVAGTAIATTIGLLVKRKKKATLVG
jgi:hypothetical protein